jgi:hypothetical protein
VAELKAKNSTRYIEVVNAAYTRYKKKYG